MRTHISPVLQASGLVLGICACLVVPLHAQETDLPEQRPDEEAVEEFTGWSVGLGAGLQIPVGELSEYVDEGFALQGHISVALWDGGWLGARLQGGWAEMGSRERRERLYLDQIPIDVRTHTGQEVIHMGLGPQAAFKRGDFGGHLYGTVGAINFSTSTTVRLDVDSEEPPVELSKTEQNSAWAADFTVGFGVNYSIVSLEATYHFRGDTEYLPVVEIPVDDPAARIPPINGRANFWVVAVTLWFF